jgi:hypothetical protein
MKEIDIEAAGTRRGRAQERTQAGQRRERAS